MLFSNTKVGRLGLAMAEPPRRSWRLRSEVSRQGAGGEKRQDRQDGKENITAWEVSCFTAAWAQVRCLNMLYMQEKGMPQGPVRGRF